MQPTKEQILYQRNVVQLLNIAQGVARRHNRSDGVIHDGGRMEMLADSAVHTLRIPTARANVDVLIPAHWSDTRTVTVSKSKLRLTLHSRIRIHVPSRRLPP
jgi:hypothetical protein